MRYKFRDGTILECSYDGEIKLDSYNLKDGERWVTTSEKRSKDGATHHFVINENGVITKGFGGKFNGLKPSEIGGNITEEQVVERVKSKGISFVGKVTENVMPKDINTMLDVMEKMTKEFPQLKGKIKEIGLCPNIGAFMGCNGENFAFGMWCFMHKNQEKRNNLDKDLIAESKGWETNPNKPAHHNNENDDKYHFKNANYQSCVAHEMGHALEHILLLNEISKSNVAGTPMENAIRKKRWNKHTVATDIIKQACQNLKKTPFGKEHRRAIEMVGMISGYATTDMGEALAEGIGDWYQNGDNACPLSKEIAKILKEKLNAIS